MLKKNAATQAGAALPTNPLDLDSKPLAKREQTLDVLQLQDALLRMPTVTQAAGLSSSTIYRLIASGQFPEPVRLGKRCTRWKAADVRAWIQSQGETV